VQQRARRLLREPFQADELLFRERIEVDDTLDQVVVEQLLHHSFA
jgi:hypothetical protein